MMTSATEFQLMEHFALTSRLALEEICARLAQVLETSSFAFDSEKDTRWAEARAGRFVINVSCPYEDGTLQEWDESVPAGATVAVTVGVPMGESCDGPQWSLRELVPRFGRAIASALETTVIHHRTWTGAGKNIPRHDAYFT